MSLPTPSLGPDSLYALLPLALAVLLTFVLLSVQSIAQMFADRDEGSE